MHINVDHSRDNLLSEFAIKTLQGGYLLPGERPQDGFARAAMAFASDEGHARRIYEYASRHWFMFSTPVLSNAGRKDGLPISCYLNSVEDSRKGILGHYSENGWLSSNGGGIGSNWSGLRSDGSATSKGGRSTGIIPFIKVSDSQTLAFSQGTSRRGSYAAYLDISHPEIEEFINIRKPTGGDLRRKCQDIDHGVNISDSFMELVKVNGEWPLIDPHSGVTTKVVNARTLWHHVLQTRIETGEPYIHWIDASNRGLLGLQREKGLRINGSNLCTEILLPTGPDRTAVCCLSSVNLTYYDKWKYDYMFIPDLIELLDNVLQYFIDNAPRPEFDKAIYSATQERALGLGAMGFHDLLQKKGIAFGSEEASTLNREVFESIDSDAEDASRQLGKKRGIAPDSTGYRNVYKLAIAPNASSSIICGNTSPGIEPYRANVFTQKTSYGTNVFHNPNMTNRHPDDIKGPVYKTAMEIDQFDIIKHAAERQPYICQGQSVNLFFKADASKKYVADVHMKAWESGLKTLYYVRSEASRRVENIGCIGCDS